MVLQKFLLEKYCDFFQSIIGISFICKIKAHALKPHLFWFCFFPSFIYYIVNKWSHNNSWEEAPNFRLQIATRARTILLVWKMQSFFCKPSCTENDAVNFPNEYRYLIIIVSRTVSESDLLSLLELIQNIRHEILAYFPNVIQNQDKQ